MYESYFGLSEKPFTIAPDPRYVFLSVVHEEALAHLLYGVQEGGGFVQLTGEVGTGKTTLVRTLLEQLPENVDLALVFNPKLSPLEFVASVCDEFGIEYDADKATLKTLVDALNAHLFESFSDGRRAVLIIDEAQGLSIDVLEQVRLLTNLETNREKLLQIILVGQPELRSKLGRKDLRQLAQRITARYHLEPLLPDEVRSYVAHRVGIAGSNRNLYTAAAMKALYKASGGVPRLINEIADRALLAAYVQEASVVDHTMVREAARQVLGETDERQAMLIQWGAIAAVLLLLAALTGYLLSWHDEQAPAISESSETVQQALPPAQETAPPEQESTPPSSPAAPAILIENGVSRPFDENSPPVVEPAAVDVEETSQDVVETPQGNPSLEVTQDMPVTAPGAVEEPQPSAEISDAPPRELSDEPAITAGPDVPVAVSVQPAEQEQTSVDEITFDEWLDKNIASMDEAQAMRELAFSWDLPAGTDSDSLCNGKKSNKIRCVTSTGNWTRISQLNRPVILTLNRGLIGNLHITIVGMDEESVALRFDGEVQRFFKSEIEPYWLGEFRYIWRLPELVRNAMIVPGSRGADVLWLRRQLSAIAGYEMGEDIDLADFDQPLVQLVMLFQESNHLDADGYVGEQTLQHIMSQSPLAGGPRLGRVD
ncbi:hypothetical protein BOW13_11935 [Solemya velum gill symbiont]|uniref:ExeA family protein n=2 Tax=Solemya velum gill symbiont TaxID=2340 RepID=UPI00099832F7|nr:ExeA family protein [Solemya velum gill symbiont]OOY61177.1 hypothetical protein BOW02_01935 [Solemya velum gill symbiont]OOY83318.1 hypothetical protein BOW13_11935 [Solemya velum gill symbiont]